MGPLEPSDLQTVMPLFVAFLSFPPRYRLQHTKQSTHQGSKSSDMIRTGTFLFFEAWPSPSSSATAVAIAEVFRFELIPDALRSRQSQLSRPALPGSTDYDDGTQYFPRLEYQDSRSGETRPFNREDDQGIYLYLLAAAISGLRSEPVTQSYTRL